MSVEIDGRPIRRLLVLGLGVTGAAVVAFGQQAGLAVVVSEAGALSEDQRKRLDASGIAYEEGGHTERFLDAVDAVVLSPGVPPDAPIPQAARARGALVLSELDFAAAESGATPIVAVTGTNGKGTTVTLIDEILRFAGMKTVLGGNIGTPFVSLLDRAAASDAIVLEVSSYQLEPCDRFRPKVGVLLNLTPDHLARHGTMAAYAAAKGRLFQQQESDDVAVLPIALGETFLQGRAVRRFYDTPFPPMPAGSDDLSPHNRLNLAAALTAVDALAPGLDLGGLSIDQLEGAFRLPHRLEDLGVFDGVRAINDSKSTNGDSSIAALRSIDGPVVLLLGGRHKGGGYEALAREIRARDVRVVVVFGEAAPRLAETLEAEGVRPRRAEDLEVAVAFGFEVARPGDTLLFSPGCSSFDAFPDYATRGEAFTELARSRKSDRGS